MNKTELDRLLWLSDNLLKEMNKYQRTVENMTALAQVCYDQAFRVYNNGSRSSLHSTFIHAGVLKIFYWYRWHTKECVLDRAAEIEWIINDFQLPTAFDYDAIYEQMNVYLGDADTYNASMDRAYSFMLEDGLNTSRSQ